MNGVALRLQTRPEYITCSGRVHCLRVVMIRVVFNGYAFGSRQLTTSRKDGGSITTVCVTSYLLNEGGLTFVGFFAIRGGRAPFGIVYVWCFVSMVTG